MEDLREFWNSKIEEQCVKTQTQDQSNRVWAWKNGRKEMVICVNYSYTPMI